MTRALSRLGLAMAVWFVATAAQAQSPAPPPLAFEAYVARVASANLSLLAARSDLSISEAQIQVAGLFPNPTIWGGISQLDVSGTGYPVYTTVQVDVPIELGGRRERRLDVAIAGTRRVSAEVADFARTLRGQAAVAWIDALVARRIRERKQQTLESLQRLVDTNEARVRAGAIGEVALLQSRVEAQVYQSEVLAAEADVVVADLALAAYVSRAIAADGTVGFTPTGELSLPTRTFDLAQLLATARERRPDVRAADEGVSEAHAQIDLAEANRWNQIQLSANWQWGGDALGNPLWNQPGINMIGVLAAIPIPLHLTQHGEVDAARAASEQAETRRSETNLRVEIEVRQAVARYAASVRRLALFQQGVLADADRVLEATLYSYERGQASLIEVLVAQRTVDDVYLAWFQVLGDHARALVEVQTAAGIWDVTF
ncbi:MAG: TolC family protein [Kofleriaceae bacterium]|nr:TolC family protein [Kofleriaceae bacterium]